MMVSVDKKIMVWLLVDNNSCSICKTNEITDMWSIAKLIYFNSPIDDVDYHTTDFDMFVWCYLSIPEEVSNITMQPILSSTGDICGILIGESPKLLILNWVQ